MTLISSIFSLQGKEIINYYINELISEGKTYFPPFQGSQGRPRAISHCDKKHKDDDVTDGNLSGISNALVVFLGCHCNKSSNHESRKICRPGIERFQRSSN